MTAVTECEVLADLLPRAAASGRGVRFVSGADRETRLDYAALAQRAAGLSGWLQQRGLRPGDALILFVRDNQALVEAFWACQLGGFVPVPLSAGGRPASLERLAGVVERLESAWLFSERRLYRRLQQDFGSVRLARQRVCLIEDIHALPASGVAHATQPQDLALIQFSSGSTCEPRGVMLTHANLMANLRAITRAAAIDGADATLSWMPLSHDMGLIGFHLVPLFNGLEQVLMDTELFIRRPALWLEKAAGFGASLLCAPNFGFQHYLAGVDAPAGDLDLERVRLVFNGAEPVSATVCREFVQRLAPAGLGPNTLFPVYGLAEATLAVSFPRPGSGLQTVPALAGEGELVCLGFAVDSCELRIIDERGAAVADGHIGHIQVRGASVSAGYYRCPDCDRRAFSDGWLDTGDLGLESEQGLVVTGRAREVFFAAGQNWYPQDIERMLEAAGCAGPGRVAVAAQRSDDNAEDLLLVFVRHRGELAAFAHVAAELQAELGAAAGLRAHAVIPVQRLPRTTSGKLQRYRLAEAYRRGDYAALLGGLEQLARADTPDLADSPTGRRLLEMCQRRFPGERIGMDRNLLELGADSLTLVGLHEDIEASFPGRVAVTDLFEYPTVRSLAAYIDA
jgi:acyl-CoA synthetase (AMP-forming)/AMP-acid ligase II